MKWTGSRNQYTVDNKCDIYRGDDPMSYTVQLEIIDTNSIEGSDFIESANHFMRKLKSIDELSVTTDASPVANTRGYLESLSQIFVTGATVGAFSAIYLLSKDLYSNYTNAEVELVFTDGSKLVLKNISYAEARKKIEEHISQSTKLSQDNDL